MPGTCHAGVRCHGRTRQLFNFEQFNPLQGSSRYRIGSMLTTPALHELPWPLPWRSSWLQPVPAAGAYPRQQFSSHCETLNLAAGTAHQPAPADQSQWRSAVRNHGLTPVAWTWTASSAPSRRRRQSDAQLVAATAPIGHRAERAGIANRCDWLGPGLRHRLASLRHRTSATCHDCDIEPWATEACQR